MNILYAIKIRPLIFCADYCCHHGCNKKCCWQASTRLLLALLSWREGCTSLFSLSWTLRCIFLTYKFLVFVIIMSNYLFHKSCTSKQFSLSVFFKQYLDSSWAGFHHFHKPALIFSWIFLFLELNISPASGCILI